MQGDECKMNLLSTPYFGKEYAQPKQVLKHYPEPNVEFNTPAFETDGEKFTTQEEMISFLRELSSKSHLVEIKIIGYSTEGRAIPMLMFRKGENQKEKTNFWVQAQIHGDEPAAGETALIMAEKLAGEFGEDILEEINVNLVPRVNPDGAYYFTRQTAQCLDANRDNFKLKTPEVRAVHKAFNQFKPDVSVVGHEYLLKHDSSFFKDIGDQGALSYHDILLNTGRNLGIPEQIRNKADDLFISNARDELTKYGFTNGIFYDTAGRNDQGQLIVQELTYGADREPSYYGLQPAFSFITETRGIGIGRESFKRRVTSAVTAQTSFLKTTAKNAETIKKEVEKARQITVQIGRQENDDDKIAIKMKNKKIPNQSFKFTDIATGKPIDLSVEYLSTVEVIPTLERVRPTKYVLLPGSDEIAKKLEINGVEITRTKKPIKLEMESYTITDKQVDEDKFEGVYQSHVEANVALKEIELPEGSYVYSMAQSIGNILPVMFEPESPASYVTWNEILSEIGSELPIYRVMKQISLNAEDIKLLVRGFEIEGSIDDSASYSLQAYLSTVDRYEEEGAVKEIIKQMKNFKSLLHHQKNSDFISDDAYDYLNTNIDSLIKIWQ